MIFKSFDRLSFAWLKYGNAKEASVRAGILLIFSGALTLLGDTERRLGWMAGFACMAVVARTLLTTGGSLTALPLNGLPAPTLSYGNNAAVFAIFYLSLSLYIGRARRQSSLAACHFFVVFRSYDGYYLFTFSKCRS